MRRGCVNLATGEEKFHATYIGGAFEFVAKIAIGRPRGR